MKPTWKTGKSVLTIAGLGLLATIAVDYVYTKQQLQRESTKLARLADSVAELGSRPEAVERIIERQDPAMEVGAAGAGASGKQEAADAYDDPPVQDPERVPTEQVIGARLDARYDSEDVDARWAREKVGEIERAAAALDVGHQIHEVACHSSLCRIQASFPDQEAHNRFVDEVAAKTEGGDGVIAPYVEKQQDGSLRTTAFWVKAGHLQAIALPPPE